MKKVLIVIAVLLATLAPLASRAEKAMFPFSTQFVTADTRENAGQIVARIEPGSVNAWTKFNPTAFLKPYGTEEYIGNAMPNNAYLQEAACSTGYSANTGGCIAYEHRDFGGRRQDLGPNRIFNFVGSKMNDEISSFRISYGCRIVAWEHRDKGGASKVFGECSYIGDAWNDRISCWKCECR